MIDFEFYVGSIEDAIIAALETPLKAIGVKTFDTYSGDFEPDNLKKALGAMGATFPLILVSYTDGADESDPKTPRVLNRSLRLRHDCSFAVICAANDPRGDNARRKGKLTGVKKIGVYTMISKVREVLGGLNLKAVDPDTDEIVLLTHDPLVPTGVEYIARMPNITAYAAIFDTYFRYATPDRTPAGTEVDELILGVESLNDPRPVANDNTPGVIFETQ